MARVLQLSPTRPGYQEIDLAPGASFSTAEYEWITQTGAGAGGYQLTQVYLDGGGISLNADGKTIELIDGKFLVSMEVERGNTTITWSEIQARIDGALDASRITRFGDDGVGEPGGGSLQAILDASTAQRTISFERIDSGGGGESRGRITVISIGVIDGGAPTPNEIGIANTLPADNTNFDFFLLRGAGAADGFYTWNGAAWETPAQTLSYTHTQGIAATTWTINHNLGFYPNLAFSDGTTPANGTNVLRPENVVHTSVNQSIATWKYPEVGIGIAS